jgi:hypothetical protein
VVAEGELTPERKSASTASPSDPVIRRASDVVLATDRKIVSCNRNNPALIHNHTKPEQVSTKTLALAEAIRADIGHYSSRRNDMCRPKIAEDTFLGVG